MAALTIFIDGDRAAIQICGRLDSTTMGQLRSQVGSLLDAGVTDLLVDVHHAYDLDPGLPRLLEWVSTSLSLRGGLLATESPAEPLPGDMTSWSLPEIFNTYRRVRENHRGALEQA